MAKNERRGDREYEFGVPIPGRILPPHLWTKTGIKRLPPEGPLNFATIFGREAPLVLDIGCGNGRFLLASAIRRPEFNHLGIDILPVVIRYATRRANQRGLKNIRFAVCGGHEFLEKYVPPNCITEIHIYHPQPFHDPRKRHRRLLTPEFLALVYRSLVPEGLLVLQTDNPAYWEYLQAVVPALFHFEEQIGPWPDMPEGRTRREIYAIRKGLPIFRGYGHPRRDIEADELEGVISHLPRPDFDTIARQEPLETADE
jgi:tRNA (guanine-N7-)-methyltransferase